AVRRRAGGGAAAGRAVRAGLRLLLRAPDPHLLRDADARLRADRLGHLLQVELGDWWRAGLVGRAVSGSELDGGTAAPKQPAGGRAVLPAGAGDRRGLHRVAADGGELAVRP